jgi:sulfite reductase beta subunit-like hemoprotein
VDRALLSTLCGCGDVERNIVAPPAPLADTGHRALHALAIELTTAMTPSTNAYREIWLDGERIDPESETEPLYGETYLPRKFKTGLALPSDDSVGVHDQDIGLIGICAAGALQGVDVLVGGGAGLTHRKPETYARLASPLGYVERPHVVDLVRAIAGIYRDFGDRTDRRHARLKYVVEEWGVETFRAELERRIDFPLLPWVEVGPLQHPHWLGPHAQGDGRWLYGIRVESGRIIDDARCRLKTALRILVETLRPTVVLSPQQNLLLADLSEEDIPRLEHVLEAHGIALPRDLAPVRSEAMACPALPTCGLALAESERVVTELSDAIDRALARRGLDDTRLAMRMTGCPNGCTRPYAADLGIVGRKPGHYDVFVGGGPGSARLGELYAESVPFAELLDRLDPLFREWARLRKPRESLGDCYDRCLRRSSRRDLLSGDKGKGD